nr:purine-binding chemotaxis protein CheW [Desulfobacula sp.]
MTRMKPTQNHIFRYITFRLAQTLMGVDILDIREILPCKKVTRVHRAPGFVMGLANLRGQILTVLDIGVLLGLETPGRDSGSHIIVFKHTRVGFAVDQIGDVFSTGRERIEPVPANISPGIQKYSDTVINLPEGAMILLKAGTILACVRTEAGSLREGL